MRVRVRVSLDRYDTPKPAAIATPGTGTEDLRAEGLG